MGVFGWSLVPGLFFVCYSKRVVIWTTRRQFPTFGTTPTRAVYGEVETGSSNDGSHSPEFQQLS